MCFNVGPLRRCWLMTLECSLLHKAAAVGYGRQAAAGRLRNTHVDLQVLSGLGEAQGVEAAVAGHAAVQPRGAGGVGQPQRVACTERGATVAGGRRQRRRSAAATGDEVPSLGVLGRLDRPLGFQDRLAGEWKRARASAIGCSIQPDKMVTRPPAARCGLTLILLVASTTSTLGATAGLLGRRGLLNGGGGSLGGSLLGEEGGLGSGLGRGLGRGLSRSLARQQLHRRTGVGQGGFSAMVLAGRLLAALLIPKAP